MRPKVCILIPCYNADRWIAQAIQSALDQTYQNKEVIVIDDGSSDRSLEIIKSFGDRIRWETGVNRGGNAARNRLLELSNGEWIQYLDADDYLLPDKIERQIQFLNQQLDTEVICSPHITENMGEKGIFYTAPALTKYKEPLDFWLLTIRWYMPQTGGLLFHRQALLDISGWQEDLKHCQDYDLYVRLLQANKRFTYFNQSGAVYRWWCSGTVTRRNILEIYRDRLDVQEAIEKHLLSSAQLTQTRKDAIYQARFEYARRIYSWDRQWAAQVAKTIRDSEPNFEPSSQIAPGSYRTLYKAVGFTGAEFIADVKRRVWK